MWILKNNMNFQTKMLTSKICEFPKKWDSTKCEFLKKKEKKNVYFGKMLIIDQSEF